MSINYGGKSLTGFKWLTPIDGYKTQFGLVWFGLFKEEGKTVGQKAQHDKRKRINTRAQNYILHVALQPL